ncbi:acyltransferase family protein [Caulobacter sp. NIBR1757]|uniref:acyltransferase family protein n=1 Tax=Caulobacter sp. NIBR1757 TaxID=3016000 RepID=UPI0022F0D47D|nr:acyltransferase family protein [Caulobacter sp. NIBR1757]WGM38521.1 Glucans biosynthesis protein C [Caulobacter sp. NIBR1757]
MASAPTSNSRRADLDWLRIGALGLLILYHVGLAYTPWDWHLNSKHRFGFMEEVILLTSPWRLTLLFLVSGAALRLMSLKYDAKAVLKQRFARLAPPLLFGTLILVPPQGWAETVTKDGYTGSVVDWWIREFSLKGMADGIAINHLWFVLYIGAYSLVAVALLTRPGWIARAEEWLAKTLTGWKLLVLPILYLAIVRQGLFPWFGLNNQIQHDWYNHASSLGVFLFGFLIVGQARIWQELERLRFIALPLALVSVGCLMALHASQDGGIFAGSIKNTMFAITQWTTVCAALGFASRHLRAADTAVKRYLNDAIFPVYMAHQTILVMALFVLAPLGMPVWVEVPLFITITFAGSLAVYEAVRRINLIRPLWGLKPFGPKLPPPAREPEITTIGNDTPPVSEPPGARAA